MIVKIKTKILSVDFKKGKLKKTKEIENEFDIADPGSLGRDHDDEYGEVGTHPYCGMSDCKECMDWLWCEFHNNFPGK